MSSTERRIPSVRDLRPLLRFRRPEFDGVTRRLSRALTIEDLRAIAKRRTPRAAFDYTDGAAEGEVSLARARQAFRDVEFHPDVLRDVSDADTGVDVLGGRSALPFGIAPTGFTRMMHTDGERGGARVAGRWGIPFALSTMGTTSIEDVAKVNPDGRKWFQLYMWKDRDRSMALVERAAAAGYDTLLVTVDVPVAGARLRDVRNGMTIPPTITARTVLDAAPRPRWWFDLLTTEPLAFASLDRWSGTVAELLDTMFDPTVTFEDLAWIKSQWPGTLVVKGVQSVADARRCADAGVDAITLSNHGGRQLDRAPVPFHLLPDVVREVGGDLEVHLDTGIMNGADIVAAVALGARFTMVGRAYLYGMMAGGEAGAERAVQILAEQVRRTMRLLGARSIAELEPRHVTQLERLVPRSRPQPAPAASPATAELSAPPAAPPKPRATGRSRVSRAARDAATPVAGTSPAAAPAPTISGAAATPTAAVDPGQPAEPGVVETVATTGATTGATVGATDEETAAATAASHAADKAARSIRAPRSSRTRRPRTPKDLADGSSS